MTDIEKKAVSTPLYDNLRPRYQLFLDGYMVRMLLHEGSRRANYVGATKVLNARGRLIIQRPEVQAAFHELVEVKRAEHEDGKQAIIELLKIQVSVTLPDLAKWDTTEAKWILKSPDEVDVQWHPVIHLVTLTREREAVLNTGFQAKALKLLEGYMMWNHDQKDVATSVSFDFSSLKSKEYERLKPKD